MTYLPPSTPPPPPMQAPAGRDRTTLWGVIGIVTGLCCCGLLGIIFGYLSVREAKVWGKSPVLGYIAIGIGVIGLIWNIFAATRWSSGGFTTK